MPANILICCYGINNNYDYTELGHEYIKKN